MAAHEWIPLRIHPSHPKVLRLVALTGLSPHAIVGHAVAWFRFVDQQFADARTGLDTRAINIVMGLSSPRDPDLASAFADGDVRWLAFGDDGKASVVDYQDNFGQSSRRRYLERRRKAEAAATARAAKAPRSSAQSSASSSAQSSASDAQIDDENATPCATPCATPSATYIDIDKEKDIAAAASLSSTETNAGAPAREANPVPGSTIPIDNTVLALLEERLIDDVTITWAAAGFTADAIRLAIGRMDAVAANDGHIDNPSGLLRTLLTKGVSGPVAAPPRPARTIHAAGPTRAQRDAAAMQQLVAVEQTRDQQILAWLDTLPAERVEQLKAEAIAGATKIHRDIWAKKTPRESVMLREAMYGLAHAAPAEV